MLHITTNYALTILCCSPHKIVNEQGKINGLPLNRAIMNGSDEICDVIAGTAFICDCSGETFGSLSDKQVKKYMEQFRNPEKFIRIGNEIMAIPFTPTEPHKGDAR